MVTTPATSTMSQAEQQRLVESKREAEVAQVKGYSASVDTGYKGSFGEYAKENVVMSPLMRASGGNVTAVGEYSVVRTPANLPNAAQAQAEAARASAAQTSMQIEQEQLQSVYGAGQASQQDNLRYAAVALGLGTAALDTSTAEGRRIAEEYAKAKYSYTTPEASQKTSTITVIQPEGQLYPTSVNLAYSQSVKPFSLPTSFDGRLVSAQSTPAGISIVTEKPNIQPIPDRTPEGIPDSYYGGWAAEAQKAYDFIAPRVGTAVETAYKLNPFLIPTTYANPYVASQITLEKPVLSALKASLSSGYSTAWIGGQRFIEGKLPTTLVGSLISDTIVGTGAELFKATQQPYVGIERLNILLSADTNRQAQLEFTGERAKTERMQSAIGTGLTGLTFGAFEIAGNIITGKVYPTSVGARISENIHVTSYDSPFGDFGIKGGFVRTQPADVRIYSRPMEEVTIGSSQAKGRFEVTTPMGKIRELDLPASQTYTYVESPTKTELPTKLGGEKVELISGGKAQYTGETRIYGIGNKLEFSEKPRVYESISFSGESVGYTGVGQKISPYDTLIRYPTYSVQGETIKKGFFDLTSLKTGERSVNIADFAGGKAVQVQGGTKFEFAMPEVAGTKYTGEPVFSKFGRTQERIEMLHPESKPTSETGAYAQGMFRDADLSALANVKSFTSGAGATPPPYVDLFPNIAPSASGAMFKPAVRDLTLGKFASYEQTNVPELGGLKNLFESAGGAGFRQYPSKPVSEVQIYSRGAYDKPMMVQSYSEASTITGVKIPTIFEAKVSQEYQSSVLDYLTRTRYISANEKATKSNLAYDTRYKTSSILRVDYLEKPMPQIQREKEIKIFSGLISEYEGQKQHQIPIPKEIQMEKYREEELTKYDIKFKEMTMPINPPPPTPFKTEFGKPDEPPTPFLGGGLVGLQSSSGFDFGKRTKTKGKYQPSFVAVQLGIKGTGISKARSEMTGLGIRPIAAEKEKKKSALQRIGGILKPSKGK